MSSGPETLYLVRHGQSVGNARLDASDDLVTAPLDKNGDPDWPLTDKGIVESTRTGEWLARQKDMPLANNEVWVSPLQRAQQTAQHMGLSALILTQNNLAERSSAVPFTEMQAIAQTYPLDDATNVLMESDFGGTVEPLTDLIERVSVVLEAAKQLDSQDSLIVVSHGYTMLALRYLIENLEPEQVVGIIAGQDTARRIGNADVIAYSRRNSKGQLQDNYVRKRHVAPIADYDSGWRSIQRRPE